MTFKGAQNSEAYSVQQTKDGNYIIAGTTFSGAGGSYAWLRKVGEEQTGTAKTPDSSPTETLAASPAQALTTVPAETSTVTPPENATGFETVLAITMLLAAFISRIKRW